MPGYPGAFPRVALDVLRQKGTCLEATRPTPWESDPPDQLTWKAFQATLEAVAHRVALYARITDLTGLKVALRQRGVRPAPRLAGPAVGAPGSQAPAVKRPALDFQARRAARYSCATCRTSGVTP